MSVTICKQKHISHKAGREAKMSLCCYLERNPEILFLIGNATGDLPIKASDEQTKTGVQILGILQNLSPINPTYKTYLLLLKRNFFSTSVLLVRPRHHCNRNSSHRRRQPYRHLDRQQPGHHHFQWWAIRLCFICCSEAKAQSMLSRLGG